MSNHDNQDIAALAKGGRTNFLGFVLRLGGTAPFLFIAGRFYGVEALGRYASALVIVELISQLCVLGQRRGLAQRLSEDGRHDAHIVADGLLMTLMLSLAVAALLYLFPAPMFPSGQYTEWDRLLPIAIVANALTDVALAALAYRYNVAATVRARSLVEPWVQTIGAVVFLFVLPAAGLALSFILAKLAALVVAFWPLIRTYGLPRHWYPHPLRIGRLALLSMPLAGADLVEWGTRKLDIALLGFFTSPTAVGVYYAAQQVASLPQKLKTSFEPILGPVITRNLREGNHAAIAAQVNQVGFWIIAAQAGIALALAIPGEGVMGLIGPQFVGGTGALAFLLLAEVVAATAVVSEAALVYVARLKNLWLSLATIALQAGLTVGGIMLVRELALGDKFAAAAAAGALMLALAFASLAKGWLLGRIMQAPVNPFRWPLVWAVAPATLVGWAVVTFLPEWAELLFGIPAILFTYGYVIWHKGFGPEDRVLFRKNVGGAPATSETDATQEGKQ
ncbi:oligosaccharide flippase family protein [Novosphingobium sp.]|uniref:lipopolysaccharide biosynthesis protein n=1 Tax=Novosphingobium sp. TaxID=1874826 RepID=UPI0022BB4AA1|nr:oligosaccharide flippase family protein [Novosphingobium sp.]MCZ8018100.1 oligosaccharide flippase family protein [Novosphingobium sp.]MCZ8034419.1 oligosaccharide flippase family protein [Novosphingobium sp.]MCZ8052387.1 oligosaccharide flippase family protein [Novosphingobium sp.]MCZ8061252.1 oligosaccharide flippase family protein [Novosphingobium sp.]MCZ8232883.1 oligosaccharide flippase family protein [Novosphingobium sp.]